MTPHDRSMVVRRNQYVRTDWIDIDLACLGCRVRMAPESVLEKYRTLLLFPDCGMWPPIVGHWKDGRFRIDDGRHQYLASLMLGHTHLFVAWLCDERS